MNPNMEEAFERLKKIDWQSCGRGEYNESLELHFGNFVRTAHAINQRIGRNCRPSWGLSGVFNFVTSRHRDTYPLPEDLIAWFENVLIKQYSWRGGACAYAAIHGYLLWHELSLEERKELTGDEHASNPYEDIIRFFEVGGAFTSEHDMLDKIYPPDHCGH